MSSNSTQATRTREIKRLRQKLLERIIRTEAARRQARKHPSK